MGLTACRLDEVMLIAGDVVALSALCDAAAVPRVGRHDEGARWHAANARSTLAILRSRHSPRAALQARRAQAPGSQLEHSLIADPTGPCVLEDLDMLSIVT